MEMKTVKRMLAVLALIALTVSCSNDNDTPAKTGYTEQSPLQGYLTATGFNQKLIEINNSPSIYEHGFSFKPKVTGKMTAIIAKLPDDVNVRVTIWDKQAGIPYRTGILNITQSAVEFTQAVDIDLVKDKEYMITVNSNDWYIHSKTDNSATVYPLTVGDIEITGFAYKAGSAQAMPDGFVMNYCLGDLSFKFLQTE